MELPEKIRRVFPNIEGQKEGAQSAVFSAGFGIAARPPYHPRDRHGAPRRDHSYPESS